MLDTYKIIRWIFPEYELLASLLQITTLDHFIWKLTILS